jgi:hypothetical protein
MSRSRILLLALVTMALTLMAADRDEEIRRSVAKFLSGHRQYQNVTIQVEDEVVTATGTVALWSQRSDLEWSLRRIEHVRNVHNQVVLDPPPVSDDVLRARVKKALVAAGFPNLRFQAHQGRVVLSGSVRTRPQWARARDLLLTVEGVREVETRVRVEEE